MRKLRVALLLISVAFVITSCEQENNTQKAEISEASDTTKVTEEPNEMTKEELEKNCDDIYKAYNNGEMLYEDAKVALNDMLSALPQGEKKNVVNASLKSLELLYKSKTAYETGIKDLEKENISYKQEAIKQFQNVIEVDRNYNDAQTHLTALTEEYYAYSVGIADSQVAEGDYAKAIDTYTELIDLIGEYGDLMQKKEALEYEYIQASIAEAEAYMSDEKFVEANNVIDKCYKKVGPDAALSNEIVRIENFTPVSLMSLTSFYQDKNSWSRTISKWEVHDMTNLAEGGFEGIKVEAGTWQPANTVTIIYRVNGKYDTFTGQFVLHEDSKDTTANKYGVAVLYIYGDDVLLYQSGEMCGGVLPMDVYIDISEIDELKFVFSFEQKEILGDLTVGLISPELKNAYVPLEDISVGTGDAGYSGIEIEQ